MYICLDRKYYEDGIGVAPNFPLALEYFGKAASKGYQPAAEKLNRPLAADGTRRCKTKLKKLQNQQEEEGYLIKKVLLDTKVKQDEDDDNDSDDHNNTQLLSTNTYTRGAGAGAASAQQHNNDGNNICTIQ